MKKQYAYISQEDLDKFTLTLRGHNTNQKDAYGIPLEFAVKFWGKDSPQGKMALAQQGLNTEWAGSTSAGIESAFYHAIMEQKEKNICFSTLGETMEGMSSNGEFFIYGSFIMDMNYRRSSHEFIQLEYDYTPCSYKWKICSFVLSWE